MVMRSATFEAMVCDPCDSGYNVFAPLRGLGYATREAHLVVDADNLASLRFAGAVGAQVAARRTDDHGRRMVRYVRTL